MALFGTGTAPKVELLINGTWTDVSSYVRGDGEVRIDRGRSDEQSRVSAQTCSFQLNNRDGRFSNRNPSSPYYGLLPRNTQVRASAGSGDVFMKAPYNDELALNVVETADKAILDVVGDIEVRADIWPHSWRPRKPFVIMSKYTTTGNQRSWALYLTADGYPVLVWSTDGTTTNRITATATSAVPSTSGRLAIKATLKANNGAAGNTVAFYTASTVGGTYTQLGASVVTPGVTSIFSSSSPLTIGGGSDNANINISSMVGFGGRFYAAEVYSSIGGTRVANADFTGRSVGDTSWSDGLATPNTWTVSNTARITSDRLRFWGELSTLPQRWDKSQRDIYVPVTASGSLRRLTQGASPLRSPLYRRFLRYNPNGYWPLEDGTNATSAASVVTSGSAAVVTNVTFDDSPTVTLPGAGATVAFNDATSRITGKCNSTTATGTASFVFFVKLQAFPGSNCDLVTLTSTGTAKKITIGLDTANWQIAFYDSSGASLDARGVTGATVSPVNQWIAVDLQMTTSGGNVAWTLGFCVVSTGLVAGVGPRTYAGSVGYVSQFDINAGTSSAYWPANLGHVIAATQALDFSASSDFTSASNGFFGETAAYRANRLCDEEGIGYEATGIGTDSETMGYQTLSSLVDLLYECADADQGMLGESRDSLALTYRTRVDLENRHDLSLSYSSAHLSEVPEPTEDDQGVMNDVTVRREAGSWAQYTVDTGTMSTLAPPNGIGRYDSDVTLNVALDTRLADIAQWKAFVGTWDEARYPNLTIGLHRTVFTASSSLSLSAFSAEVGDTVTLTGLPTFLPPDDVPLLCQGYTETLGKFLWTITFNTTPAGPYRLPWATSDDFVPRADSATTVLNAAITSTATSLGLKTSTGALWVTTAVNPTEFPFNIKIAGEVLTVTAIVGATSPQTATVTRSVNGVVKAQVINAPIFLAQPSYASL